MRLPILRAIEQADLFGQQGRLSQRCLFHFRRIARPIHSPRQMRSQGPFLGKFRGWAPRPSKTSTNRPNCVGSPALPRLYNCVCVSKMLNSFSLLGIVSPCRIPPPRHSQTRRVRSTKGYQILVQRQGLGPPPSPYFRTVSRSVSARVNITPATSSSSREGRSIRS